MGSICSQKGMIMNLQGAFNWILAWSTRQLQKLRPTIGPFLRLKRLVLYMASESIWKLKWQVWPKWWPASPLLTSANVTKSASPNSWSIAVRLRRTFGEPQQIWEKMTTWLWSSWFMARCYPRAMTRPSLWPSTLADAFLNTMGGVRKKVTAYRATNSIIIPTLSSTSSERWMILLSNSNYLIHTLIVRTASWTSPICLRRTIWVA